MNIGNVKLFLKNTFERDSKFVFNALVISMVILSLIFAFEPYIYTGDPQIEEIKALDRNIVTVHPGNMSQILQSKNGNPVMLVMYASWCGYCKQVMPMLVDMVQQNKLGKVEPVFLSIDEQPRLMSRYLVHKGYDKAFIPYRMDHDIMHGSISEFVYETGSHYRGAIPYIGFFNSSGKLISDATGPVTKSDFLRVLKVIQNYYKN